MPSYGQEIFEVLRFLNNPIFVQQNTELDRKIRFRLDVNETKKFSLHLRFFITDNVVRLTLPVLDAVPQMTQDELLVFKVLPENRLMSRKEIEE